MLSHLLLQDLLVLYVSSQVLVLQPLPDSREIAQSDKAPEMSARNRDSDLESGISDIDSNITPVGEVIMQEGNVSMNILLDIQSSVKRLDRKFNSIHKTVCDLKKNNKKA